MEEASFNTGSEAVYEETVQTHDSYSPPAPDAVETEVDYRSLILPILCRPSGLDPRFASWAVTFAIIIPHLLYAVVWIRPEAWRYLCGDFCTSVFAAVCIRLKFVQLLAMVAWIWTMSAETGLCFDMSLIGLPHWLAFLAMLGIGKMLVFRSFRVAGSANFFYGLKLEGKERESDEFPFSLMSHPECLGHILCYWSYAALLMPQLPHGTIFLLSFASLLQCVTALIEDIDL